MNLITPISTIKDINTFIMIIKGNPIIKIILNIVLINTLKKTNTKFFYCVRCSTFDSISIILK